MDKSVPKGAALLLDFIGQTEAPLGYNTIYGNNQDRLKIPITSRTVDQLIKAQSDFTRRYGSSASGRYQFMKATLQGLKADDACRGSDIFSPGLQDRLALCLLRRRGYDAFMAGKMGQTEFARRLAMEWASLPVLVPTPGAHRLVQRGQSYYAGDKLNRALVSPEAIEALLAKVKAVASEVPTSSPAPQEPPKEAQEPVPAPAQPETPERASTAKQGGIALAVVGVIAALAHWWHDLTTWIGSFF